MTPIDRIDSDRGLPAAVPETQGPAPAATRPDGAGRDRPRLRPWLLAIAGAIVLPLAVAAGLTLTATSTDLFVQRAIDATVVSAAALEEEYGIKVTLVAVTADGGLVDVRFTVLDRDKAGHVLHDAASLPQLLLPDSGSVLRSPQARAHKLDLVNGASYFLLYPNSGGLVQAGASVSVVIDEIRLEPVLARS
jgi:hypothetical protein